MANQVALPHKPELVVYGPEHVPLHYYKDTLQQLLKTCTMNQSLVVSNIVRVKGLIEIIKSFFPFCNQLEHLYFYMVPVYGPSKYNENDPEIDAALNHLASLKSLVFQGPQSIFAEGEEASAIQKEIKFVFGKILHLVPQLETLVLSCLILDNTTAMELNNKIRFCQNMKKLELVNIQMKDSALTRILEPLTLTQELKSLSLHNCAKFTSEESRSTLVKNIGAILNKNQSMSSLSLMNLNLQSNYISCFLEPFSKIKFLKELTLGGQLFSDENQPKLVEGIGNLKTLKVFRLYSFALSGVGLYYF